MMGIINYKQREYGESIKYLEKALGFDMDNLTVLSYLGLSFFCINNIITGRACVEHGAINEGIKYLRRATMLAQKSNPKLLLILADALIYADQLEQALVYYHQALGCPNIDVETKFKVLYNMSSTYLTLGNKESYLFFEDASFRLLQSDPKLLEKYKSKKFEANDTLNVKVSQTIKESNVIQEDELDNENKTEEEKEVEKLLEGYSDDELKNLVAFLQSGMDDGSLNNLIKNVEDSQEKRAPWLKELEKREIQKESKVATEKKIQKLVMSSKRKRAHYKTPKKKDKN